jgi:transposase
LWVAQLEQAVTQHSGELSEQADSARTASIPKPRREFPAHLPRETQTIAPQESCCPDCDGELKHLGEDVCEMLELDPVRFKVIRHVRPKLACASCDTIVQAPAPTRPIERGMAGPGLLEHVIVGKYGNHLPLYRQEEIFAREGVELERTLLAQWVGRATALLTPLTEALHAHVLAADVVHADDTPIPVLAPGNGKTKTGRLWTYVRDERPSAGEGCAGGLVCFQRRSQGRASATTFGKLPRRSPVSRESRMEVTGGNNRLPTSLTYFAVTSLSWLYFFQFSRRYFDTPNRGSGRCLEEVPGVLTKATQNERLAYSGRHIMLDRLFWR